MCRAFATLGHDPGAILLDAAASQMVDNIAHFRPQVCALPEMYFPDRISHLQPQRADRKPGYHRRGIAGHRYAPFVTSRCSDHMSQLHHADT